MRKIAIAACFGLLLAIVPATTSVQAATPSTADLRVIHGIPKGPDVDVWVDGAPAKTGLAAGEGFDASLSAGFHAVVVCVAPSTSASCAPGGAAQTVLSETISVAGGTTYTLVVEPNVTTAPPPIGRLTKFVDDSSPTALGKARFQFNHGIPAGVGAVSVCLDGEAVAGLTGVTFPNSGITEVPEGTYGLSLDLGGGCGAPDTWNDVNLVAGTSFVLTATAVATCGANCVQVLLVGQGRPANVPDPAFCKDVLGLSDISKSLDALLGGIVVGTPSTYPTPAAVTAAVDATNAAIMKGDENVPLEIKPQWEIVTAGLRDLTTGLALVGGDVSQLPPAQLQKIVDGINSTTPDPEIAAATAVLTTWYLGNCLPATPAEVTPAAAPVSAAPAFTG